MLTDWVIQAIMAVAIALGLSGPGMVRVAQCESSLNPLSINPNGHYGLFQLSRGHLALFAQQGWSDWRDPSQITYYVGNYVLQRGWGEWSCGYRYF